MDVGILAGIRSLIAPEPYRGCTCAAAVFPLRFGWQTKGAARFFRQPPGVSLRFMPVDVHRRLFVTVDIPALVILIGIIRSELPVLLAGHFISPEPEIIHTDIVPGMLITKLPLVFLFTSGVYDLFPTPLGLTHLKTSPGDLHEFDAAEGLLPYRSGLG